MSNLRANPFQFLEGKMEDEVKVSNLRANPFGLRVLVGLEEKRVKYEYQEENLAAEDDLLLKMNIPVLIHNGNPVLESLNILEYIDQTWPNINPFLPTSAYERAKVKSWASFVDQKIYTNRDVLVTHSKMENLNEAKRNMLKYKETMLKYTEAKNNMLEYLKWLEDGLGQLSEGIKPYFGGQNFGYMDIVLTPFAHWIQTWNALGDWKIPLKTKFPRLHEWVDACMDRESVKKILNGIEVMSF